MAVFPKIQSPCPYIDRLSMIMDGDMCRACKRQVFDLTDMSNDERMAFMKGCATEVCVSYRLPIGRAMAAALTVAAITMPVAAHAQDQSQEIIVLTGGIKDPAHVEYIQDGADAAIPALPVVYEDAPAAQTAATTVPAKAPSDK